MFDYESIGERKASTSQMNGAKMSADRRRGQKVNAHASTSEKAYTDEEREFLGAVERYKAKSGRRFPSFTEILGVARELGYARPM